MSEPSGHDCPRCSVELFIEVNEEVEGVDLLICKLCWGVGITAKSLDSVISTGSLLDETREEKITTSGDCKCPMCSTIMDEIELEIPENVVAKISMIEKETNSLSHSNTVIIDSCSNCPSFWFDAGELDLLNGITPKLRGSNYDKKTVRLLEDPTLTEEDFQRKKIVRGVLGGLTVLGAIWFGFESNDIGKIIAGILGIGGLIAMFSSNPEQALVTGTCDKCWKPDKLLAWNCQRGGCWAHICSDCESIGDDPVETYAKTLGAIALGVIVLGVGAAAISSGGIPGGGLPSGSSEKEKKPTKIDMLLCRECTEIWKGEKIEGTPDDLEIEEAIEESSPKAKKSRFKFMDGE
ncbi:MAG: hypothetical protein QGI58_02760 [Candidatus Thalassarchaeaceae archaeon]|jgi:Zn-finger nucleic acid-binding protein|nr:hypothetical protein [Candidatus Thalassarchaeaceae archaeon]